MYDLKKIGSIVRELRGDMSLREFANKCKVSHTTIDNIEKGWDFRTQKVVQVKLRTLEKIADSCGVPVTYLIGTEEEENPWELELLTAFAALDIDQQIKVVRQVNALAADSNHEFKLTPEGSIMIGKLTGKEVDLIIKYREKEHLQAAIDKLLDVKGD